MPSIAPPSQLRVLARGRRPRALSIAAANLFPLVGVIALGWNAATLLTLYWIELGIASLWALVRGLFAGRPSEIDREVLIAGPLAERRGALSIPGTGVAVRFTSLLTLPAIAGVLALVWFVGGAFTVGVVVDGDATSGTAATLGLAVVGVFVGETTSTLVDYFGRGEYRDHSAQTAVRGVFGRGLGIFFGALVTVLFVGLATLDGDAPIAALDPDAVGLPLLLAIVGVKAAFDLAGLYRDRLAAFDEASALELGIAYDPPSPESVDGALSGAVRTVRQPRRARLAGVVATAARQPGLWYLAALPALVALLFAIGRNWATTGSLLALAVALPAALAAVDHELRYGLVDYRVGDDALVAHDRLFGQALWRVEPWNETALRVERGRLDRRLGTETVVIELRDDERRIPRLADVDPILDVFGRAAARAAGSAGG